MTMVNEPGTRRLFASDMFGRLYSISYDGNTVKPYQQDGIIRLLVP